MYFETNRVACDSCGYIYDTSSLTHLDFFDNSSCKLCHTCDGIAVEAMNDQSIHGIQIKSAQDLLDAISYMKFHQPLTSDEENEDVAISPRTNVVDIHKIIDDAMEKRDRTVSIYIGEAGVSVNVYPVDHDKVQWIHKADNTYDETYCRTWFQCSNCGHDNNHTTPYCPVCGEFMHGVRKECPDEKDS